jgi:hypothetical protein
MVTDRAVRWLGFVAISYLFIRVFIPLMLETYCG